MLAWQQSSKGLTEVERVAGYIHVPSRCIKEWSIEFNREGVMSFKCAAEVGVAEEVPKSRIRMDGIGLTGLPF